MADLQSWTTTAADVINKIGIPSVLVVVVLLIFVGVLPSVLTSQHAEIMLTVRQIRTISASFAGMRHAECTNKADVDSGSDAVMFTRQMQRCNAAYEQLRLSLENIGAEAAAIIPKEKL